MFLNLIFNLWYIPVKLSFYNESSLFSNNFSRNNLIFSILPFIIFVLDPIVNLKTGFYSRGEIIKDKKFNIQKLYEKSFHFGLFNIISFYFS